MITIRPTIKLEVSTVAGVFHMDSHDFIKASPAECRSR